MVSRRFACLLLAASMTLSSIWIVSADQSHQIQDAAAAAATYSAAVQVLEGAGLSQSAEANAGGIRACFKRNSLHSRYAL